MEVFFINNMAPIMFGVLVIVLLLGYPAAFSLGAVGLIFALIGIELGQFSPNFLQALPDRIYGVMSNETLLAIPFFTFMGLILRTIRHGGGPARHDRAIVRHGARRACLCGRLRRRATRGDHGRGGGFGHLHGPDLTADHVALRIRPARGHRHHRRRRHVGADHPALHRAHRDGRPARPLGRRHVRGRVHSRAGAVGDLRRLYFPRHADVPKGDPRPAPRSGGLSRRQRQSRPRLARRPHAGERRFLLARHAAREGAGCGLRRALSVLRDPVRLRRHLRELGYRQADRLPLSLDAWRSRPPSSWSRRYF